jgi:N-acetylglucosamine-6-phosphate deacetylase
VRMASTYPAQSLGIADQLGEIAAGYLANLAIFDDHFRMMAVVDQGQRIEVREARNPVGAIV